MLAARPWIRLGFSPNKRSPWRAISRDNKFQALPGCRGRADVGAFASCASASAGDAIMAMALGGSGSGPSAVINVTPLIDVLLVLLIIFMVITPLTPKGLDALVPQPPKPNQPPPPPNDRTIVVQVIHQGEGQRDRKSTRLNSSHMSI